MTHIYVVALQELEELCLQDRQMIVVMMDSFFDGMIRDDDVS